MVAKRLGVNVLTEEYKAVLGCKWSVAVLVALYKGFIRPSQILRHYPSLTGKVLWERLSKLTALSFVRKVDYHSFPRHTEYHLTEQGRKIAVWAKALMESGLGIDELTTVLRCRYMVAILKLLSEQPRRPKSLKARLRVADKILFDRLAKLEVLGLVQREIVPTRPVQVRYHITERGRSLLPLLPEERKRAAKIDPI